MNIQIIFQIAPPFFTLNRDITLIDTLKSMLGYKKIRIIWIPPTFDVALQLVHLSLF